MKAASLTDSLGLGPSSKPNHRVSAEVGAVTSTLLSLQDPVLLHREAFGKKLQKMTEIFIGKIKIKSFSPKFSPFFD